MSKRHQLRVYDYVNRPYEAVRAELALEPSTIFRRATTPATAPTAATAIGEGVAQLRAKAGPVTVGNEITIEVVAMYDGGGPADEGLTLELSWQAARRPELFPVMRASLRVYPLTPTETQLDLEGTYDPPLGLLGDALDAVALNGLAEQSVTGFLRDVARFLREPPRASDVP